MRPSPNARADASADASEAHVGDELNVPRGRGSESEEEDGKEEGKDVVSEVALEEEEDDKEDEKAVVSEVTPAPTKSDESLVPIGPGKKKRRLLRQSE